MWVSWRSEDGGEIENSTVAMAAGRSVSLLVIHGVSRKAVYKCQVFSDYSYGIVEDERSVFLLAGTPHDY